MKPRLASLDGSIRAFAHRGASAHAPENTLEAFALARDMGATAVETDAWLTADGRAVLHHDAAVGPRLRRRPIASLEREALPDHIASIEEFYEVVGPTVDVSIDLKDHATFEPILAAARAAGDEAEERLWLCHPDLETLASLRRRCDAKLVFSTRLRLFDDGPERSVARLRERGIDVLNLPHAEWNGGLVALVHRFERYAFGWGAQHEREIAKLIDIGIDGVYSDHVDRLTAVLDQFR